MGHLLKVTKTIGFGATGFRATGFIAIGFIAIGFRWVFRQVPFSETPAEIEVPKKLVSRSKDLIALPAGSAGGRLGQLGLGSLLLNGACRNTRCLLMLLSFSLFGNVDDGVGGENRVDRGDGKRCRGIWASVQVFDYSLGKVVAWNPIVDVVKQVFECVNHPRYFGLVDFCRGCFVLGLILVVLLLHRGSVFHRWNEIQKGSFDLAAALAACVTVR